jgi:hypothetical protein
MADLLIQKGQGKGPAYASITDANDVITWLEPPPAAAPAGALPYRRLGALKDWRTPSPFLYTVEIDVAEADIPALAEWYEGEHLAMLAAVPGTLGASRYENIQGSDIRFLAAYRFATPGIPETPAWIEARSTPWTERMRPLFRTSRRFIRRLLPG